MNSTIRKTGGLTGGTTRRVPRIVTTLCVGALAFPWMAGTAVAAMSDEEIIANATSAAPKAVGDAAAVIEVAEDGQMRVLREGSNGFTCMADNPASPGNDPMCLDANGMRWAEAWMGKSEPPAGVIGFGYMLQGGSDASNTDPHAAAPADGDAWVETGPHVMIFNYGEAMSGYPEDAAPDTSVPYVMWGGTPYEHLMIPVSDAMTP